MRKAWAYGVIRTTETHWHPKKDAGKGREDKSEDLPIILFCIRFRGIKREQKRQRPYRQRCAMEEENAPRGSLRAERACCTD